MKQTGTLGANDLVLAESVANLALLYNCEGKYVESEPLYAKAAQIREANLGPQDPQVLQTLEIYASMLRQEGKKDEARKIETRTVKIKGDSSNEAAPRS